jgi:hypothetical protein
MIVPESKFAWYDKSGMNYSRLCAGLGYVPK